MLSHSASRGIFLERHQLPSVWMGLVFQIALLNAGMRNSPCGCPANSLGLIQTIFPTQVRTKAVSELSRRVYSTTGHNFIWGLTQHCISNSKQRRGGYRGDSRYWLSRKPINMAMSIDFNICLLKTYLMPTQGPMGGDNERHSSEIENISCLPIVFLWLFWKIEVKRSWWNWNDESIYGHNISQRAKCLCTGEVKHSTAKLYWPMRNMLPSLMCYIIYSWDSNMW